MSKRLLADILHGFIPVVILVSLLVLLLPALGAAAPVSNWMEETSFATSPDQLVTSPAGWELQDPPGGLGGDCTGLVSIWGSSPSDVFAIASCGALIHYDGNNWRLLDTGPLVFDDDEPGGYITDIWGNSSSELFVVGDANWREADVFRYDGSNWMTSATMPGDSASMDGIWGSSASDVFAVGGDNVTGFILHYNGSSWSDYYLDSYDTHLSAVWGSSASDVFAVGGGWYNDNGTILRYNGSAWSPMTSGTTSYLNGVWGSSASDVFAVGGSGTILHYNGIAWSPMDSGSTSNLSAIWGSSPSDVFAVGSGGTILHYDGSAWSPMTSGTTSYLNGIWGSGSCDVFAVGRDGTILHYSCPVFPATATGPATDVSTTSAVLNGNLTDPGSASSVQVSFEWGLTTAYGNATAPQTMTGPGAFSGPLNALTPHTTYHFRARAVGDGSVYGDDMTFTTGATPPTVTTNAATGTDTTAAALNGDLTDPGSASSVQVSFEWGLTTAYDDVTTSENMTGTGSFSYALSDLAPATAYYYRAKAVGDGTSYGVEKSFTTAGKAPRIESLTGANGRQGKSMTITISGSNLSNATEVDFGAGITVSEFSVVSDSEITAKIAIESGAEPGTRDVTVTTPWGTSTDLRSFLVNDAGKRVHLWVYLVVVVGGMVGLSILAPLGLRLRRGSAR